MRITSGVGSKGAKGDKGDPGAASIVPGPKGDQGTPGTAGAAGTNATTTTTATTTTAGLMSPGDKAKLDRKQARIVTTDATGLVTWTYPIPFPAGVVPVIEVTPQNNTNGVTVNHKVTSLTNTAVTVQVTLTSAVVLLGISVLGIAAASVTTLHLTAEDPT